MYSLVAMVTYLHENPRNVQCNINMLPYQTPGISNQALVSMRDVKLWRNGRIFWQKVSFLTTPLRENGSVREFVYLETF